MLAAASARRPPPGVRVRHTLALGAMRFPVRFLGRWRTCVTHDWLAARWIRANGAGFDVFHGWPLSSLASLRAAASHGIRCFLERPNAHTEFAYQAVAEENARLGFSLPDDHDHAFNPRNLAREECEYSAADHLLCPSEFVHRTFAERGYEDGKLMRHQYGFDSGRFVPDAAPRGAGRGLVVIYAGVGEPRKGLHHALKAWKDSGAGARGRFLVCGEILPAYLAMLAPLLDQPGVELLGPRRDLPALMANADALVLSSVEEGSALVTYEARGAGCVLLVSDCSGAICSHGVDALIHQAGDVAALTAHIARLDGDRALLARLREASLAGRDGLSWDAAGRRLLEVYREALAVPSA